MSWKSGTESAAGLGLRFAPAWHPPHRYRGATPPPQCSSSTAPPPPLVGVTADLDVRITLSSPEGQRTAWKQGTGVNYRKSPGEARDADTMDRRR